MTGQANGFVCPYCHRTTVHPTDVAERYCPCCGCPPLLAKDCEHTRGEPSADLDRLASALVELLAAAWRRKQADASRPPRNSPGG